MSHIYRRRDPWSEDTDFWIFIDRVEHYFRLKTVSLDDAAMLVAGIIPEHYTGFGFPWFDTIFISNTGDYDRGDDREALLQWLQDCKDRWLSDGRPSERINFYEFVQWVTREYEQPHWMPALERSGKWGTWTAHLVTLEAPTEDRRAMAHALLEKHDGNKAAVAREMGISRTRVNQLLSDNKLAVRAERKPLTTTPSDPFGLAAKSLNKKKK